MKTLTNRLQMFRFILYISIFSALSCKKEGVRDIRGEHQRKAEALIAINTIRIHVQKPEVTKITASTASIHSKVSLEKENSAYIIGRGIDYWNILKPAQVKRIFHPDKKEGEFTIELKDLEPGTTYQVKAFAMTTLADNKFKGFYLSEPTNFKTSTIYKWVNLLN